MGRLCLATWPETGAQGAAVVRGTAAKMTSGDIAAARERAPEGVESRTANVAKAVRSAWEDITLRKGESYSTAGERFVKAVRATFLNADMPHMF